MIARFEILGGTRGEVAGIDGYGLGAGCYGFRHTRKLARIARMGNRILPRMARDFPDEAEITAEYAKYAEGPGWKREAKGFHTEPGIVCIRVYRRGFIYLHFFDSWPGGFICLNLAVFTFIYLYAVRFCEAKSRFVWR